jgi:hypothetical protein
MTTRPENSVLNREDAAQDVMRHGIEDFITVVSHVFCFSRTVSLFWYVRTNVRRGYVGTVK